MAERELEFTDMIPEGAVAKKIHRRRDANPRDSLEKYGKTTFADPVNKKYPIDTLGRIKAAWAYIHQPSNAEKYTLEEIRTMKLRVRRNDLSPHEYVLLVGRATGCAAPKTPRLSGKRDNEEEAQVALPRERLRPS